MNVDDPGFAGLAVKAYQVMLRREWHVVRHYDGLWYAAKDNVELELIVPVNPASPLVKYPDPFTALLAADAWMKQHESPAQAE